MSNDPEAGRPPKRAAETVREEKVTKKKAPEKSKSRQADRAGKALPGNHRAEQSAAQQPAPASPGGRPQLAPSGALSGPSSPQRPAQASPSGQQPAQSPQRAAGALLNSLEAGRSTLQTVVPSYSDAIV